MLNEVEVLKALEDKTFAEKIFSLSKVEEVQAAFKNDKKLELSLEDLEELKKVILQNMEKLEKGEITEEELLNVAGGFWPKRKSEPFKGPLPSGEPAHGITPRDLQNIKNSGLRHVPNPEEGRTKYRRAGDNEIESKEARPIRWWSSR